MWVRSAFWVGRPKDEAAFRTAVDAEIVPQLNDLPGVEDVQALWPRRIEDGPPDIHCQILVYFRTLDALEDMLASLGRMRARVCEIAAGFVGTISHIDYEVG